MGSRREQLVCHPADDPLAVEAIGVRIDQGVNAHGQTVLSPVFDVVGDSRRILPGRLRPLKAIARRPRDGLWTSTCFELFYRCAGQSDYYEFNGTASGHWAHYHFDDYRLGQSRVNQQPDGMAMTASPAGFTFSMTLPLAVDADQLVLIGLAAVIEHVGGMKSHWALRHPSPRPDFHHRDCFAVTLAAPNAP